MKSTIESSRFSWSSYPENASTTFDYLEHDMPQTQHKMPAEIGEGWFQSIHLPLNMVVRKGIVHFKKEIAGTLLPVATIEEHFCEPVLCVQSTRNGRVVLLDHKLGNDFIFGHEHCLFEHINVRESLVRLDASEDIEMTTLIIGDSLLNQLLGETCAQSLLNELRVTSIPSTSVNKIPQHITALLHSSISSHLTAHISKLYIQIKVLDYLCALSQYFAAGTTESLKSLSDIKMRIHQIHDDLLQLEGKVPSLNELSSKYDIPVRKLKEGFAEIYGKSLFSYISEVRLDEAHAALEQTDTPMKTISRNLGYSHVNHFITAFKKQFGYSPGSLRRKKP